MIRALQDGVSLLVANLSVVTAWMLRIYNGAKKSSDDAQNTLGHFNAFSRRAPPHAFGDVTTQSMSTTPTHIHLHIETLEHHDDGKDAIVNEIPTISSEVYDGSGTYRLTSFKVPGL